MKIRTKYLCLTLAFLLSLTLTGEAFSFPADVEDVSGKKYFPKVIEALAKAERSINVVMYVMELPKGEGRTKPRRLIDELVRAHERGVDVEVILDQNIDFVHTRPGRLRDKIKSISAYKYLKGAGINVSYDDSSRYTHAKVIVIDGKTVILGSTNWTKAALERNIEVSILVRSERMAKGILDYIDTIKSDDRVAKYAGQDKITVPVRLQFMKDPKYGPRLINNNAHRAFDVYLFLLWKYDGNPEGRVTLFYDTVAGYLGIDTMNRTAYRRQIIKVLRKLEDKFKLIRFEPLYAKEATITLVEYGDINKAYSDPKEIASSPAAPRNDRLLFELDEGYFDYGWNRDLTFSGKYCYFINIINADKSDTKPVWTESVKDITKEFGGISPHVVHTGMDELRRKRLIEVAYDTLTGKPYNKRKPKVYKVLELYDLEQAKNKLREVEDKYGKGEYDKARSYAEIVFEDHNPEAIEDIIIKTREYGREKVRKAFDIVAQKNKDNPKRKYGYVVGILENWGKGEEMSHNIKVKVSEQKLYLYRGNDVFKTYPVSTSKYGTGNKAGSNKTPLGSHRIVSKIGGDSGAGAVFVGRKNTGDIAKTCGLGKSAGDQGDQITTRILRLEGTETGVNKGEGIDSFERYIYIHGTPHEGLIGKPASRGCIRMKNEDIVELFELVGSGTTVEIVE